jgi:hypothetical protein
MSVDSPFEISQAKCLNFNPYVAIKHDPWQRDRILMLNVCLLLESPKVALNFSKNISKSLNKHDWCFNKGVNQTKALFDNKMSMSPTWVGLVRY